MTQFCTTPFPDDEYLHVLAEGEKRRVEHHLSSVERLVMYSGAEMNWIGDALTDPNVHWEKKELQVDDLVLTQTTPEWNEIIIHKAERSPAILRKLIQEDVKIAELFAEARWSDMPILVHAKNGYHIFDGMHRTVAAIRENKQTITAWVAMRNDITPPQPSCEPHVIYDFLRAYRRGSHRDRSGVIIALRFLRKAYGNVDLLLKNSFNPQRLPDEELQLIITEALQE